MINIRYDITCPYCGFKFHVYKDICINRNHFIIYCDREDGGCDKRICLTSYVNITREDYVVKIEPPFENNFKGETNVK